MVELVGDPCAPSSLIVPIMSGGKTETMSGTALMSGELIFNSTDGVLEYWAGTQWVTVDNTPR